MKRNMKRKGFTLVELLIVIVVIGILSAMMMLSSTEAVTSAKASNIVSNLRNLKTAALSLYVDSLDTWKDSTNQDTKLTGTGAGQGIDLVKAYMNSGKDGDFTGYSVAVVADTNNPSATVTAEKSWYLKYHVGDDSRVQAKLAGRAKSIGLLKAASDTASDGSIYYTNESDVYYKVR